MTARAGGGDPGSALLHARIAEYYTQKVQAFGCTPLGADWTCIATQEIRFVQLLKLCDFTAAFSIDDLGCGYGAMAHFLHRRHGACAIDYLGIDLSAAMIWRARQHCRGLAGVRFVKGSRSPRVADYAVASGIFNVRQDEPRDRWDAFIRITLQQLAASSRLGFAVNFVAPPANGQRIAPGLYTTPPEPWVAYCADQIGADAQVVEGYGMQEFSLLVRRRPVS